MNSNDSSSSSKLLGENVMRSENSYTTRTNNLRGRYYIAINVYHACGAALFLINYTGSRKQIKVKMDKYI
jgi:hypothetical protein